MGAIAFKRKIYGRNSAVWGDYYAPIIYSEEEREVGVWYNNKPLYQRTWVFSSSILLNSNTWTDTPISNSDIESIVYISAHGYNSGKDNNFSISATADTGNYIKVIQYRNSAIQINKMTMQYTKTTDVAGSGNCNSLGVPTVHYSTDEQVIGTWINGKTLYQKSIEIQSVPSNSWDTFSYGISEAVTVRDYKCMIFNGDVAMSCDHNRPDTVNSEFYCVADKAGFFIRTFNNNYSGSSAVVTIYYTKDND